MPLHGLLDEGYAIASVDYRLSPQARFPAQVHDIKAAIRFLHGNQERYPYDVRKVAIAGSSAGGHLAALVGVTNGTAELEGSVGPYLGQSSEVHAIIAYFGASNLLTILQRSTPRGQDVPDTGPGTPCSEDGPSGSGNSPHWLARSFMPAGQTLLCSCCMATRIRKFPSTSRMSCTANTRALGWPWTFAYCMGPPTTASGFS